MMRKRKLFVIAILYIIVTVFAAADIFAQEEEEVGFIKREFRRFLKRRREAAVTEKRLEEEPVDVKKEQEEILPEEVVEIIPEERKPIAELTKAELIESIIDELEFNEEILDFIPRLKISRDKEGNIFYTYELESGIAKRLEEIDRAALIKIFNKVGSEASRLNAERIVEELERIRRVRELPKSPQEPPAAVRPPSVPSPLKIYTPPQTPTTPARTPAVPKQAPIPSRR